MQTTLVKYMYKAMYSVVGFHMTTLKFKLQNFRSYWYFIFMKYWSTLVVSKSRNGVAEN